MGFKTRDRFRNLDFFRNSCISNGVPLRSNSF